MEKMNEKDGGRSLLLDKYVFQMTGHELCSLIRSVVSGSDKETGTNTVRCTGIHALAEHLGCCESTIYMLKRAGVLNDSVISQVGKKIVFDVEKARVLADEYQKVRRASGNA